MKRFLTGYLTIITLCWLVAGGLFASIIPGGAPAVVAVAIVATSPLLLLIRGFTRGSYPRRAVRLFVLRPFWYLQLLLPVTALAGIAGMLIGGMIGAFGGAVVPAAIDGGRIAIALALLVAGAVFIAGYLGSRQLVVRRFVASAPNLPPGFEGVRVVQLSDLHVGPHTPRRKLARIAQATRDAEPDLIALTGDLVDDYIRDVEPFEDGLGRFEAPLGVYAIAGNHDVYAGWDGVRAGLEAQGIAVLVNSAVRLERNGDAMAVLGTGDPAGHQFHLRGGAGAAPDVPRAVAAARSLVGADGFVLALAHNPVLWPAIARERVALTLSGHTHWGQFAIPGLGWSLASPFLDHAMGAYTMGDAVLYVHPGTNYWGLPFRLGTPPEVAVITLRRGAPALRADD